MQPLTVVLLGGDAGVAQSLVSALSKTFSSVQKVQSLGELRNRIAKNRAEVAILDIEAAPLSEIQHLSQDFPGAFIVCTHRVADEEMWAAALQAGAADVCPSDDIAGIVHAALGNAGRQRSAAA
jgi:DNA-binding NarL/FixJ family response regulator